MAKQTEINFFITAGVSQTVEILDPTITPERLIEMLESGDAVTSCEADDTFIDRFEGEGKDLKTIHIAKIVQSGFNSPVYENFELNDLLNDDEEGMEEDDEFDDSNRPR